MIEARITRTHSPSSAVMRDLQPELEEIVTKGIGSIAFTTSIIETYEYCILVGVRLSHRSC